MRSEEEHHKASYSEHTQWFREGEKWEGSMRYPGLLRGTSVQRSQLKIKKEWLLSDSTARTVQGQK